MQHIYTPEEYFDLQKLQQELRDIQIETNNFPKKNPKAQTIRNILAYSKALEVKKLERFPNYEQILN